MSEESSPPQLRLRPRKRDDEPAVVPPASPPATPVEPPQLAAQVQASVTTESAAEVAPLRFRLKPKLSSDADAPASGPAADPVFLPASVPPVIPPPVAPVIAAPEEGVSEMPRLKLKPQSGGDAPAPEVPSAVVPPSIPAPATAPAMMPAFPVMQPQAPMPAPTVGALPPLPISAPPPLPPPLGAPPVVVPSPYKAKAAAKHSKGVVVLVGVIAVLLAAGAGGSLFLFTGNEPEVVAKPTPRPVIPKVVPPSVPIAPLPPPPTPFLTTSSTETAATSTTPLSPVVTPAFRSWVADVRVTGVRSGSSTMAIINGRLARPGDVVDAAEGIVFDSVDDKRKALIFRSRNGAFLEKAY